MTKVTQSLKNLFCTVLKNLVESVIMATRGIPPCTSQWTLSSTTQKALFRAKIVSIMRFISLLSCDGSRVRTQTVLIHNTVGQYECLFYVLM